LRCIALNNRLLADSRIHDCSFRGCWFGKPKRHCFPGPGFRHIPDHGQLPDLIANPVPRNEYEFMSLFLI
jgi:hypothetical protein